MMWTTLTKPLATGISLYNELKKHTGGLIGIGGRVSSIRVLTNDGGVGMHTHKHTNIFLFYASNTLLRSIAQKVNV